MVADTIEERLAAEIPYHDMMVLVRTSFDAKPFEAEFIQRSIPYRIHRRNQDHGKRPRQGRDVAAAAGEEPPGRPGVDALPAVVARIGKVRAERFWTAWKPAGTKTSCW